MDPLIVSLRILHIVLGTFWVGSDGLLTFVLLPRLRALGPDIERPVMATLMRVLPPIIMVSSIITAIAGVWLAGIMLGWSFDRVLATRWGWAILVGFVGTLVALIVGFGLLPPVTMRMDKLSRSIEGRSPTPDEGRQLEQLTASATALARLNSVLLILVVGTMAVARFV